MEKIYFNDFFQKNAFLDKTSTEYFLASLHMKPQITCVHYAHIQIFFYTLFYSHVSLLEKTLR